MILLTIYAILVWVGVAWWRRTWPGALLLAGSMLPIAAFTLFAGFLSVGPGSAERLTSISTVTGYARVVYVISAFYAALIFSVGLLIFVQPRRMLGHQCRACGYDMRGSVAGICPECGRDHEGETVPASTVGAANPAHVAAMPTD